MVSVFRVNFTKRLTALKSYAYLRFLLYGLFLTLAFAPFHRPGCAFLALACLFYELTFKKSLRPFWAGLLFGIGFFGFGISWVFISVHTFGHLNYFISALITFALIVYLSLFTAGFSVFYRGLASTNPVLTAGLFSSLWVISELLRSTFLTGFPWLLIGFGQIDSPLKFLLPVIGVSGVGFISCLLSAFLAYFFYSRRIVFLLLSASLLATPLLLKNHPWVTTSSSPLSVAIVQANLSMRDKWDEGLFWQILKHYQTTTATLLGTQVIVWPESAIPLPADYLSDFLEDLQEQLKAAGSSLLTGIPQAMNHNTQSFYNSLSSFGASSGSYHKQHLVPFGEFIPAALSKITTMLDLPDTNLRPGNKQQSLLRISSNYVAALICYEIAYGELLRAQLPAANYIVSISDDGWFGHSLAVYQQLQMAQVRSLETGRYQLVANNDGLSSLINEQGRVVSSLPVFEEGVLKGTLFSASGETPWVSVGDLPTELLSFTILFICLIRRINLRKQRSETLAAKTKRRYPYQPC